MRGLSNARRDIHSRYVATVDAPAHLPRRPRRPDAPYADAFGRTVRGLQRRGNDDQYLIAELDRRVVIRQSSLPRGASRWCMGPQGKLFAVTDGTGAGATAPRTTLDSILGDLMQHVPGSESPVAPDSRRWRGLPGGERAPGMTLAYVSWPGLHVIHRGGSRCYLFRSGRLYQITSDHTATGLHDGGVARTEVHRVELQPDDRMLLCTGGLTRALDTRCIAEHLDAELLSANACDRLIDAAVRAGGGAHSVTVVVCRFG